MDCLYLFLKLIYFFIYVSLLIPQSSSSRSCKANPLEFDCVLLLSEDVKLLKNEVKKKEWKLSIDEFVGDVMKKLIEQSKYEHTIRSFK